LTLVKNFHLINILFLQVDHEYHTHILLQIYCLLEEGNFTKVAKASLKHKEITNKHQNDPTNHDFKYTYSPARETLCKLIKLSDKIKKK
jgi:hypothetical protein